MDLTVTMFKTQLDSELQILKKKKEFESKGKTFQYWYFKNIWNFSEDLIDEIDTDGGRDQGIDAIYIDDENCVHFFQFKNCTNVDQNFPQGEAEKTFGGISLLQSGKFHELVNEKLRNLFVDVLKKTREDYIIHFVSSGQELHDDAKQIFDLKIKELNRYGKKYSYECTSITSLTIEHTKKLRYKVPESITIPVDSPYFTKSRKHTSYLFTCNAKPLVEVFDKYKDKLLEQNIRANLGVNKSTNAAIYTTCTTDESMSFCHYNNGITFLCDKATYDQFTKTLNIEGAQIVNGGQTISTLYKAYKDGKLRGDVEIPVRTINTDNNTEFASNVTVNLNNQNKIESSFLKSNNPILIQLQNDLRFMGYLYERRGEEFSVIDEDKEKELTRNFGPDYKENIVPQIESAKAYAAFFKQMTEIAKKRSGELFKDKEEGGVFERVFDHQFSSRKLLYAYKIFKEVELIVDRFSREKRRKISIDFSQYTSIDNPYKYEELIKQVIPQISVFALGILYVIKFDKKLLGDSNYLEFFMDSFFSNKELYIKQTFDVILNYFIFGDIDRSVSTVASLKSQSFYNGIVKYLEEKNMFSVVNKNVD